MASSQQNDEYYVVLREDGLTPIHNEVGDVLVQHSSDGSQWYVNPQTIDFNIINNVAQQLKNNGVPCVQLRPTIQPESNVMPGQETSNNGQSREEEEEINNNVAHWSRHDILKLISEYRANKENFASTSIKNVKVWQNIAKNLRTHTPKQCENKFKYLKAKYLKKKDNMSIRSSGSATINFEYYNEFDDLFRQDPMVEPLAIASSSRENNLDLPTQEDENNQPLPPAHQNRNRNTKLKDAILNLNELLKQAESNKEKRHQEILELHRETANKFHEMMQIFLDKI